jgi:PIN domain nuclease of toxin-antitoxin system
MFVTDSHPLIWFVSKKHSNLSPKALSVFERADKSESLIYIPAVVLWEIAILQHLGKIDLNEKFDHWANRLLKKQGFAIIPLEISLIKNAVGYNFNNDLFDKTIVASAVELDLPLMTKDHAIIDSNLVEIYW